MFTLWAHSSSSCPLAFVLSLRSHCGNARTCTKARPERMGMKQHFFLSIRVWNIKTIIFLQVIIGIWYRTVASSSSGWQVLGKPCALMMLQRTPPWNLGSGSEQWWTLITTNSPLNPKQLDSSAAFFSLTHPLKFSRRKSCIRDKLMSNSPKISTSTARQRNAFAMDMTLSPNNSCLWFCSSV